MSLLWKRRMINRPLSAGATVLGWFTSTAERHHDLDVASGLDWSCRCGACRAARKAGWRRLPDSCSAPVRALRAWCIVGDIEHCACCGKAFASHTDSDLTGCAEACDAAPCSHCCFPLGEHSDASLRACASRSEEAHR